MRQRIGLPCLALMLTVSIARADILPTPDRGPPMGSAGGLDFAVQSIKVEMGPVNGPHYSKTRQVVVLVGCTDGHPNCQLARSRNLIGMEVGAIDGAYLRPDKGMVRQIIDAFAREGATGMVTLELFFARVARRASRDCLRPALKKIYGCDSSADPLRSDAINRDTIRSDRPGRR